MSAIRLRRKICCSYLNNSRLLIVDRVQTNSAVLFARDEFAHTQFRHIQVALKDLKNWQVSGLHHVLTRFDGVGRFSGGSHDAIAGIRAHAELLRRGFIVTVTETVADAASVDEMIG
jgi:hypothetical protein